MSKRKTFSLRKVITRSPVPVDPASTCDCVTQALWQRNLAWRHPEIREEDLIMISESDVLITSGNILQPLQGGFRWCSLPSVT